MFTSIAIYCAAQSSTSAFANSSLQTVTVPKSVTAIGPVRYKICRFSFWSWYCMIFLLFFQITIILIWNFHQSAFEFCSQLSSVSLPTSLNYIFSFAFQNTGALKSIFIPTYVRPFPPLFRHYLLWPFFFFDLCPFQLQFPGNQILFLL